MATPHVVLVFIDGLRPDALAEAIENGKMPHLERLLGAQHIHGWVTSVLAPAPSITFASQASLITGAHPNQHDVPGNQFFDRFGVHSNGKARHYAFDIGDTLEVDDAVEVFTRGLASRCLGARTIYERAASRGERSVVVGHMYANGADKWLPPKVDMLARLTKLPEPLHITPAEFDQHMLEIARQEIEANGLPDILTVYFMGMDAYSHKHGPAAQRAYLRETLDDLIGELVETVEGAASKNRPPLWLFAADHGQRPVPDDGEHAIPLAAFQTMFASMGRDLLDHPGEGRHSDTVLAFNGSMALVYLRKHQGEWQEAPEFATVKTLGQRFWQAHQNGKGVPALEGALAGVFVRNVEADGWRTPYVALTPEGEFVTLETWFRRLPSRTHVDAVHRLQHMTSPLSGDMLLLTNPLSGRYFGHPVKGLHGGLSPEASQAALALAWPGVAPAAWQQMRERFAEAIRVRCETEGGRAPQTVDVLTGLEAILLA